MAYDREAKSFSGIQGVEAHEMMLLIWRVTRMGLVSDDISTRQLRVMGDGSDGHETTSGEQ